MENTGKDAAALNGAVGNDEDTPMNPEQNDVGVPPPAAPAAPPPTTKSSRATGTRRKKRTFEEVDEEDEEESQKANTAKPKKKRSRLHSPQPVAKATKRIAGDNGDDDDKEMEEQTENGHNHDNEQPTANATANAAVAAAVPVVATKPTVVVDATKAEHQGYPPTRLPDAKPPRPNLRMVSEQTPGKFEVKPPLPLSQASCDSESNQMELPSRRLIFNSTPTAALGAPPNTFPASSNSQSPMEPRIQPIPQKENLPAEFASEVEHEIDAAPEQTLSGPWTSALFWFFIFALFHLALIGIMGDTMPPVSSISDQVLYFYKSNLFHFKLLSPPIEKVVNKTRQEEIKQLQRQRQQQKQKMLKDIKDVHDSLVQEIKSMKEDTEGMAKDIQNIRKQVTEHQKPLEKRYKDASRIQELLKIVADTGDNSNKTISKKAWSEIMGLLDGEDKKKLLDLSSLDLWEIPEIPDDCGPEDDEEEDEDEEELLGEDYIALEDDSVEEGRNMSSFVDEKRLKEFVNDLRELVDFSTDEIVKDADTNIQVKTWIRSELESEVKWGTALSKFNIEELSSLIKTEEMMPSTRRSGGALPKEALLQQIAQRLEIEIADKTGRYDYAAVHNGASVIRKGQLYTTPSLRRSLPYFNRLMANIGLQFYGHDAEAALTPTVPHDALGQCWAYQNEEALAGKRGKPTSAQDFSRGTVATLAVRLAKPAFVHSVVIEHLPAEITDRVGSAIHAFRVVGFEDINCKTESYELGRFEYKNESPMVEFPVARELSRRGEVPKLRSIVLAIESTWGGKTNDYGCLYRFRVHGDDNE